jgi:hypothetical protein
MLVSSSLDYQKFMLSAVHPPTFPLDPVFSALVADKINFTNHKLMVP